MNEYYEWAYPPAPPALDPPRVAISVERKLSDGNYGSYGASIHISGVTADTTEEEIDALLGVGGKLAWAKMIAELGPKLEEARRQ